MSLFSRSHVPPVSVFCVQINIIIQMGSSVSTGTSFAVNVFIFDEVLHRVFRFLKQNIIDFLNEILKGEYDFLKNVEGKIARFYRINS